MVKVSIEVRNGAAYYCNVAVRAQSIAQAVSVVRGSYPDCLVRVRVPIDPEGYFVKDPAPLPGIVGLNRPPDPITA